MTGMAEAPADERAIIDRMISAKGASSADEGANKVALPGEASTIGQEFQELS